jgi:hypothetical protein
MMRGNFEMFEQNLTVAKLCLQNVGADNMAYFWLVYSFRKQFSTRQILDAKLSEPGGGCNLERSRMRRAID